jgi:hypothetical protein
MEPVTAVTVVTAAQGVQARPAGPEVRVAPAAAPPARVTAAPVATAAQGVQAHAAALAERVAPAALQTATRAATDLMADTRANPGKRKPVQDKALKSYAEEPFMNTWASRAILGTVAVTALLFSSAGVAQAGPYIAGLEPWPGGLTVHVVNNNGTATWCTYSADLYRSLPFFLPANGGHDVVIVPSYPENRWWSVGVSCDNQQAYRSSEFY